MLAGGKRLSPTEPTGETGGLRSNSDEVEKNNDCLRVYTSPPPTAEPLGSRLSQRKTIATGNLRPQGEALESGEGWDVKKPSPEGGEGRTACGG